MDLMFSRAREVVLQGPLPSPPFGQSWSGLMQRALFLAHRAMDEGEVPVGALVVSSDGRIVGEGWNKSSALCDPSAHAEIMAMRQAGERLSNYRLGGCTLVVTLEPCAMCAAAMVHARLAGLVFGAADALAGCVVSKADMLDWPFFNHHVWHMGGVESAACARLLQDFFSARR